LSFDSTLSRITLARQGTIGGSVRCFDRFTRVTEPRPIGPAHLLRANILFSLLATGKKFRTVIERAGVRRCE
jgi:hypothetical protein